MRVHLILKYKKIFYAQWLWIDCDMLLKFLWYGSSRSLSAILAAMQFLFIYPHILSLYSSLFPRNRKSLWEIYLYGFENVYPLLKREYACVHIHVCIYVRERDSLGTIYDSIITCNRNTRTLIFFGRKHEFPILWPILCLRSSTHPSVIKLAKISILQMMPFDCHFLRSYGVLASAQVALT
jgi:hypothetical protein